MAFHVIVIKARFSQSFHFILSWILIYNLGKYFVCQCIRCRDPTELGTYSSGIRCTSCPSGVVLPDSGTELIRWTCSTCTHEMSREEVTRVEDVVQNIIKNIQQLPINHHLAERCEELFTTLPKKLHPNNVMLMQLKIRLIHFYGNVPGFRIDELPAHLLQRKAELCSELLEVLRVLSPGYSRLRGVFLFPYRRIIPTRLLLIFRKTSDLIYIT